MKKIRVLVVDDDPDILTALRMSLRKEAGEVVTEKNPELIRHHLHSGERFDLLLLDMNFNLSLNTGNEGLYWLSRVREWDRNIAVVMITAYADIDLAINSLKAGADDFMVKPWSNEQLLNTISSVLDKRRNGGRSSSKVSPELPNSLKMIGESRVMTDIFRKIEKISPTDANVLILGENGTGKDMIAKAIYENSQRRNKPFVRVDMGALTDSLFESELFGHKKGAFTDAKYDRIGLIESANGGTLFLDEIAGIELYQQAKLLTVLQNREVTRVGDNKPVALDIRVISATNVPMSALADESKFRKDLIYRINTIELHVPPLRERGEDIELLAGHFLKIYAEKYSKGLLNLGSDAVKKLNEHSYPGNVRELQYCIERAVIMSESSLLTAEDILFSPIELPVATEKLKSISSDQVDMPATNLADIEESAIISALKKYEGNVSRAAKELGITRASLYRRMQKYDL